MAKTWEQMTQAEKIEDLRHDLKNTMTAVNSWAAQQKRLGEYHNDLMKKVSEVSAAVQALAAQSK